MTNERGVCPGYRGGFGTAGARAGGLAGCFLSCVCSVHGWLLNVSGWAATLAGRGPVLAGCATVAVALPPGVGGGFGFDSPVGVVGDMADCIFSCSEYGRLLSLSGLAATLAGRVSFTLAVGPPLLAVGVDGAGAGDGLAAALAESCFLSCPAHQGLVNLSGVVATLAGRESLFTLGSDDDALAFSVGVVTVDGEFLTNLPSGYECFDCEGESISSVRLIKLLSDLAGRFSVDAFEGGDDVTGIRTSGDRLAASLNCGDSG